MQHLCASTIRKSDGRVHSWTGKRDNVLRRTIEGKWTT
jgi:ketosteroid isomerase-like protein